MAISHFDPQGRLSSLFEQSKIIKINGNCTVETAQVILLEDTNHDDKGQRLVRGEIANFLKGEKNLFLCETYPSTRVKFFPVQIERLFAPNLELTDEEKQTHLFGWDDNKAYTESSILLSIYTKKVEQQAPVSECHEIFKKIMALSIIRTQALFQTIQEKHRAFPESKIFVFGGQGHLGDPWLLEQLVQHELRFVAITPSK